MYGMTTSGNLFDDELTEWILKAGFIQSQCQMSIYYKYALDVGNLLFYLTLMTVYIDKSEPLGKWFIDTLGKIFHVNFLECSHWFMSIRIFQMKNHYISVDKAIYATSIVANNFILPQLRQVQSYIRPLFHLI